MKSYDDIAAEDFYEMGYAWAQAKNFTKAKECLQRSIEMNPHFIYAYITLSEVLCALGNYREAAHVLKKASKIDPAFHRLDYLQARCFYKDGNLLAALKAVDRAISSSPQRLYIKAKEIIQKSLDREKARKKT
ncbi:MAG: tetratricopeptide repeat protein [Spirochaetes bacterium]|nr:tetratricopeptide repeat protein [Spirochaetota bacterium]